MPQTQTILSALAWASLGVCAWLAVSGISSILAARTRRIVPAGELVPAGGGELGVAARAPEPGECLIDLSELIGGPGASGRETRTHRLRAAPPAPPAPPVTGGGPERQPRSPGDLILTVHMPPVSFQDGGHLRNFLGYMASSSARHPGGPRTAWNMVEIGAERRFNSDRKAMRADLLARFGDLDPAATLNDIVYVGFLVEVEGQLWSNLCSSEDGTVGILAVSEEKSLAREIFGIAEDVFQSHVAGMTADGRPVHPFEDSDPETRLVIEHRLRDVVNARHPAEIHVSVSHNDQEQIMHVHRLIGPSQTGAR